MGHLTTLQFQTIVSPRLLIFGFLSEPPFLEPKTRLNLRVCQLNYNTMEQGKRWEVTQANVITLYLYV